ncbi:hypothetical protein FEE95_00180 [Maribacter algarum]|uniref:Outer membrane protein beta-barrel domain-containing protein n=1 Tax=Maribacter algarum (ex Zhang et al. 2020) TaxID=2578118 RepID=A0A5S3PS98_9FLAO|nr:hypothetical protein [Maribacter algarum]TMM57885.1 hypothetical protein FEE95_00180 [Maribacter algarum]
MNKFLLIIFLLVTIPAVGQEVYLESGKTFASFDFTDSQGNQLENLQPNANHYIAFGYRNGILFDNLYASTGISLSGYGAIGSDDGLGNFMQWDVNYIDFNGSLDYEIIKAGDFAFYVKGQLTLAFMVQGNQTINNQVINLRDVDEFNKTVLDTRFGGGFSYLIYRYLSFYVQYMYGKTWSPNVVTSFGGNLEDLRISSHNIGLGLRIVIE